MSEHERPFGQMRELLREARAEKSRMVAEAFAPAPAPRSAKRRRKPNRAPPPAPSILPTGEASEVLLRALNRAAAVETRWRMIAGSGS
jgi:hypothetical protein